MPVLTGGQILGGRSSLEVAEATYSFAVSGGAVGTITLPMAATIPSGAIILGGLVEVTTVPTSGGAATIAVTVESAGDIVAAAAITGAPWSTTGRKSVIPAFTGATTVKTTAERSITITVATAALTAGVFNVYLVYFLP
jgi:hypothetical protein